jgi:hypothetical protein
MFQGHLVTPTCLQVSCFYSHSIFQVEVHISFPCPTINFLKSRFRVCLCHKSAYNLLEFILKSMCAHVQVLQCVHVFKCVQVLEVVLESRF